MTVMRTRFVVLVLAAALLGSSLLAGEEPRAAARRLSREGYAAAQKGDWAGFLAKMREADALLPGNPTLLYNMACGESRTGDLESAARHVAQLLDRKVDPGLERDEDLAALRASDRWPALAARVAELKKPVGAATEAFVLAEKGLVTEGIAYDPKTKAYFVSSVRKAKILRRGADGTVTEFVPSRRDGLMAVLALRVDPKRRLLWATTGAIATMEGYRTEDAGKTGLVAFDLGSGKLVRSAWLPAAGAAKDRLLGDLELLPDGSVVATDGTLGGIWKLTAGTNVVEPLVAPGVLRSPQGLVLTKDGKAVLVATYAGELFRVSLAGGPPEPVPVPDTVALDGTDGLVRHGDALIAIQNGVRPVRIARLTLDAGETRVASSEILEMNDARVGEPTLGIVVDGALVHVADAQWESVNPKGEQAALDTLKAPVFLRLPLPRT